MEEASSVQFGDQLRDVFANILIYSRPSADPAAFWHRHSDLLCQDYLQHNNIIQPTTWMYNTALLYLQDRFQ